MALTRHDKKHLSHLAKNYPEHVGETRKVAVSLSGIRDLMKSKAWDKNKSDDQLKFKGTAKRTALLSRIKGVKGYGQ